MSKKTNTSKEDMTSSTNVPQQEKKPEAQKVTTLWLETVLKFACAQRAIYLNIVGEIGETHSMRIAEGAFRRFYDTYHYLVNDKRNKRMICKGEDLFWSEEMKWVMDRFYDFIIKAEIVYRDEGVPKNR